MILHGIPYIEIHKVGLLSTVRISNSGDASRADPTSRNIRTGAPIHQHHITMPFSWLVIDNPHNHSRTDHPSILAWRLQKMPAKNKIHDRIS